MNAENPNYLFQTIQQDAANPKKTMLLSLIAVFEASQANCPIIKYELLEPSANVKVADSSCDISKTDCKSQTIEFDVGDGALQTFKVKVTAEGGSVFTSEKISISKGCVSIKSEYDVAYPSFGVEKVSTAKKITLPFIALDATDACGVKTIELQDVTNTPASDHKFVKCSGTKCELVEVVNT